MDSFVMTLIAHLPSPLQKTPIWGEAINESMRGFAPPF